MMSHFFDLGVISPKDRESLWEYAGKHEIGNEPAVNILRGKNLDLRADAVNVWGLVWDHETKGFDYYCLCTFVFALVTGRDNRSEIDYYQVKGIGLPTLCKSLWKDLREVARELSWREEATIDE